MTVDTVSCASNAPLAKQPQPTTTNHDKMTLDNAVMRGSRDPRLVQVTYNDDLNDLDLSDTAKLLTDSSNEDDQMELDILLDEIVHDVTENEENILISGFEETSAANEPDSPVSASYDRDVMRGYSTPESTSDVSASPGDCIESRYEEDELAAIPLVALEAARDDYVPPPDVPPPKRRRKSTAAAKPKQSRAKRSKTPKDSGVTKDEPNKAVAMNSCINRVAYRAPPSRDVTENTSTSSSVPAFSPSLMFPTIRQSLLGAPNPLHKLVPLLPVKDDCKPEKKQKADKPKKATKRKSKAKTSEKAPKVPKLKMSNSKSHQNPSSISSSTSDLWSTELFPAPNEQQLAVNSISVPEPPVTVALSESSDRTPSPVGAQVTKHAPESPLASDSDVPNSDMWCSDLFPRMDEVKTPSPRSDHSPTISLSFVLEGATSQPEDVQPANIRSLSGDHSDLTSVMAAENELVTQQPSCVTTLSSSITEVLARPPVASVSSGMGEIVSLLTSGPLLLRHPSQLTPQCQTQLQSSHFTGTLIQNAARVSPKCASPTPSQRTSPTPALVVTQPSHLQAGSPPPPPYHSSPLARKSAQASSSLSSPPTLPPPPQYVVSMAAPQHISPPPPLYQSSTLAAHYPVQQMPDDVKSEDDDDASSGTDSSSDEYDENGDLRPTDDPKRLERRRYNNRVAAQRCRQRKREHFQSLKKEIQEWECQNTRLKYEIHLLQKQLHLMSDMWNEHSAICSHFVGQAPVSSSRRHHHSKKKRHRHHKKKRRSHRERDVTPSRVAAPEQPTAVPVMPQSFLITAQT